MATTIWFSMAMLMLMVHNVACDGEKELFLKLALDIATFKQLCFDKKDEGISAIFLSW